MLSANSRKNLSFHMDMFCIFPNPIIVAADNGLICGERRLRAVQSLGESTIEVRRWPDLTDDERRAIELAENLDRKDLTELELSRQVDVRAEATAEALREEEAGKLVYRGNQVSQRGPAPRPDSQKKVAAAMGMSQSTLNLAKQHVAAVEKYPELEGRSRYEAVATTLVHRRAGTLGATGENDIGTRWSERSGPHDERDTAG
jgi:hypothetical protein